MLCILFSVAILMIIITCCLPFINIFEYNNKMNENEWSYFIIVTSYVTCLIINIIELINFTHYNINLLEVD